VPTIPESARRYLDKGAGVIIGKSLKCNGQTGKFVIGDGTEEIDPSCIIFNAHCDKVQLGYVNFEDGGQPKRVMGPIFAGFEVPERSSLGDLDESLWPESQFNGEKRDPWQPQTLLVLQNAETNELYTLVASSVSARNAVDSLLRQYSFFPDQLPLVNLKAGKYLHKTRKTWIYFPDFRIVGRTKTARPAQSQAETQADFQDEVPF
jgi:hypothetical protein